MNKVAIPKPRLRKLACDVARRPDSVCRSIFDDPRCHDIEDLKKICSNNGIWLVQDQDVPCENKVGVALEVSGTPFIVIDKGIQSEWDTRTVLAHELGHVLLGHLHRCNFAVAFSETLWSDGSSLQELHSAETEVEAEAFGWMCMVPDAFLDREVEKTIYIRTNRLAESHGLDRGWMAARVSLYRLMHGYERSIELLRLKDNDPFAQPDFEKWVKMEGSAIDRLGDLFPKIDAAMLGYILAS